MLHLQIQDFYYAKDYIKKTLDRDNRVITHGEPLDHQEQVTIQKLAALFTSLLEDINENYQKYIVKIINQTHLVLDNDQLLQLAQKYQATPPLVDQLIRIRRISQAQIDQNDWSGAGVNGGPAALSDYLNLDILNLEILYQQLFEHFQFPKQLQKCVINSHQIIYYSTIKETKVYFNPVLMAAEHHLKAYEFGLVVDAKQQQILFPLVDSRYSRALYHEFIKTNQVHFFNFEQFGIWLPKPEPTTFKEWLVKTFDLQTVPQAQIDDATGLMTNINYAKDDPECLVKRYRIANIHRGEARFNP